MISVDDVSVAYDRTVVVSGVSLAAQPGQVVGLIGPNGSGKTTLLRTVYAALAPRAGLIRLDDTPVRSLTPRQLARRVGVVTQEGAAEVPVTVAEMVLLGRSPHRGSLQAYAADDYQIAAAALRRVGARQLADRVFATLSGGEKQRVLVARTLAQQADHLLLDEPTNHLDIGYQHEILLLVRTLGVTTLIVLHDLNLAARYCDRLVLLDRGAVVCAGPPEEVLTPQVLEPVYRVGVRVLPEPDCVQLLFAPRAVEITTTVS
ncbi:MAG: ABC transporter ATP-binding protein [Pseudonocardiaceae bacterium]